MEDQAPAVALHWFLLVGLFVTALAGGGVTEILKATLLARLKVKAEEVQRMLRKAADEINRQHGDWEAEVVLGKPAWWTAVLGGVASVVGVGVGLLGAYAVDIHLGLGAIVGFVGGVNALWLWQPLLDRVKALAGRLGS